MSDKLQLTTQSTGEMEKRLAELKKLLRVGFAQMRNAGAQMVGWRVIVGDYMNQAKAELPHGGFEDWVAVEFGMAKSTQHRWREFSTLFLAEVTKLKSPALGHLGRLSVTGKGKKKAVEMILEIAPRILQDRGEVEFMRDCKLLRDHEEHHKGGVIISKVDAETCLKCGIGVEGVAAEKWPHAEKVKCRNYIDAQNAPDPKQSALDALQIFKGQLQTMVDDHDSFALAPLGIIAELEGVRVALGQHIAEIRKARKS